MTKEAFDERNFWRKKLLTKETFDERKFWRKKLLTKETFDEIPPSQFLYRFSIEFLDHLEAPERS